MIMKLSVRDVNIQTNKNLPQKKEKKKLPYSVINWLSMAVSNSIKTQKFVKFHPLDYIHTFVMMLLILLTYKDRGLFIRHWKMS